MLFIEYPKCTTCKKAKKYLDTNNIKYEERNIVTDNPTFEELKEWIKLSGKDVNKFFNTSGIKYRKLNLKEKIKTMSNEEKIKLLSMDGMLIRRPILISEKCVLVGFKIQEWEDIK